jgi:hypothetical protein
MSSLNYRNWLARLIELLIGKSDRLQESSTAEESVTSPGEPPSQIKETDLPEITLPSTTGDLDDTALRQLTAIRHFASWSKGQGQRQVDELKEAFSLAYPGKEELVVRAIREGQKCEMLEREAYRVVSARGKNHPDAKRIRSQALAEIPWALPILQKTVDRAQTNYSRREAERAAAQNGRPLSKVKPRTSDLLAPTFGGKPLARRRGVTEPPPGLHGSDIRSLPASPSWTILIDETGTDFGPAAAQSSPSRRGKFIAIVIPASPPSLKPLPKGWHAVDCESNEEIDTIFQAVLDAEVGVLGVEVTSLPVTPDERWMDGIGFLVDWILRLLPVNGPTKVEVLVENRGDFTKGQQWQLVERDCLRRMAMAFPAAAAWIDLNIQVIAKYGSPLNGYVDAVAYTWAGTSQSSRDRLALSRLAGPCLLDVNSRDLLMAWDSFAQGVNLPSSLWWNLLPSADKPATMAGTLLWKLGVECQADAASWSIYLVEARVRMAAGGVDLTRLGSAVDWLERIAPDDASIPPLLRVCWLTVKLARSNHMGTAESAWEKELTGLTAALVDENAPLVCYADLHLAVAKTNRYDFESATASLDKWKDLPVAIPGLQYWGQVKSSLGQHAAFQGRNEEAVTCFAEAIDAFGRLSDPRTREKEVIQTACYRAIAMIDSLSFSDEQVKAAVERVTGPLPAAAECLATDESPGTRYAHHLLLRWLVHRGDEAARSAYLASYSRWFAGDGHPWPLIQIYRAILVREEKPLEALHLALDGASRAFTADQGPVVRLIGACCRKIAAAWGEPWPVETEELTALKSALPNAKSQLQALETWNGVDTSALELLRTVLPFNFR